MRCETTIPGGPLLSLHRLLVALTGANLDLRNEGAREQVITP
jgi:hypothetical protein